MNTHTFSVIPKVKIFNIPVLDVSTGITEIVDFDNLFPRGDVIYVDLPIGYTSSEFIGAVKERMRQEIYEALVRGQTGQGLNDLLDLSESPPRFIELGLDPTPWLSGNNVEAFYTLALIDYGMYSVDMIRGQPLADLNFIRIFRSVPSSIQYNNTEYFKPDTSNLLYTDFNGKNIEASCGFQYFYQSFGSKSNYSKFVGNTKTNDVVKKIKDWCEKEPPQFQEWLSLYKDHYIVKERSFSKIKPLPEWLDIGDAVRNDPQISIVDLTLNKYSNEDEYNSMTIMDILKLCMWMRLNLIMVDDMNQYYLSYLDDSFEAPTLKKRKKRGAVVVKIIDNHGYFVIDSDLKKSAVNKYISWETDMPMNANAGKNGSKINEKEEQDKVWEGDADWIQHPRAELSQGNICWEEYAPSGNASPEDWKESKERLISRYCRKQPPPSPQQLMKLIEGDKDTIYWIGKTSLNGLVDYLLTYHNISPDSCKGLAHTIKKATYGKLKIMTSNSYPQSKYPKSLDANGEWVKLDGELRGHDQTPDSDDSDDEYWENNRPENSCLENWFKKYPELKNCMSPYPTATLLANTIYDTLYEDREYLSSFNHYTRKIFFDGEIKPDERIFEEGNGNAIFSLDFKKAYTNAMKLMDCDWCVFDAIDQPKRFRSFKVDAWYLCKETRSGFPYKSDKGGLVLYHGCLLRHLLGKGVIPVYIITSHKVLSKDYFKKFVEKCYDEITKDKHGEDWDIVSGKQLVNCFIGNLKKRDGITGYNQYINRSKVQVQKAMFQGRLITNLNEKSKFNWRKNTYLCSYPQSKYHFYTGQPIRLQIMEKINEMNLLLHQAYKVALWFVKRFDEDLYLCLKNRHLAMVKTDALYYEYKDDISWSIFTCGLKEKLNLLTPTGYEVRIESTCDANVIYDRPDPYPNLYQPIPIRRNCWINTWDLKHKWKLSDCRFILKYCLSCGGCNFDGVGGTGKTEIAKTIDEETGRNRIRYRWIKLFHKLMNPKTYYIECEEWRNLNPVYTYKLAPTNKACNNIKGKTFHKGLGIPFILDPEDEEEEEIELIDNAGIDFMEKIIQRLEGDGKSKPRTDIIICDEISMINGDIWSILCYLKIRIPTIKFLLFGDIEKQLPPVKEERRNFIYSRCIKELVNSTKITLHYNFRRQSYKDPLWEDWSLHPERFKIETGDEYTWRNLSYTNKTRKKVIELIQDRLPNPIILECKNPKDYNSITGQTKELKIQLGTPLIARRSHKDLGFAKNEIFTIVGIADDEIKLYLRETISLTKKDIMKYFLSAYCITIHKSQGDTYTDKYTIWDWDNISSQTNFKRRLRNVAQGRSKDPEKNIIYR